MIKEIIEMLTGIHIHGWKYSGLKYFRTFNPPDRELFTRRECRCGKKQKCISYLNQEGEVWGGEWVDL